MTTHSGLARYLVGLERRLKRVEGGTSSPQLPFSSIANSSRGLVVQESTGNLCENPSFETGFDGWFAHEWGTLGTHSTTLSGAQALHGVSAAHVVSDGFGNTDEDELGLYTVVDINFGATVSAYCSVYPAELDTDAHELVTALVWYDRENVELGRVQAVTPVDADEWAQTALLTASVPLDVDQVFFVVYANGAGSGAPAAIEYLVDGVMVFYGTVTVPYVDGDQDDALWDGAPHESSSVRVPDPSGQRVAVTSRGIKQYDQDNQEVSSTGARPGAAESYSTVVDPGTGDALSTMNTNGDFTGSRVAALQDVTVGATSVGGYIGKAPGGLVAYAIKTTDSADSGTSLESPVLELQFTARAGHHYAVETNPLHFVSHGGSGGTGQLKLRATFDGTEPSIASTAQAVSVCRSDVSTAVKWTLHEETGSQVRVLLTLQDTTGSGTGAVVRATALKPVALEVVDIGGKTLADTGVVRDGSGGGGALAGARFTTQYPAAWTRSYDKDDDRMDSDGGPMYQGYYSATSGNRKSVIGFDSTAVQADLAGATVELVRLRLYASSWFRNSGGTAVVGDHNLSAPTSTHPGYTGAVADRESVGFFHLDKPELAWIDVLLGNEGWLPDALKNGDTKGFILDATGEGTDKKFTGTFHGDGMDYEPILEITYVK